MQKARISLASANIDALNQICSSIQDIAERTKTSMAGPVTLPTKQLKITTRKSPDGEGKASWERYSMRIHKRIIDIPANDRILHNIMRISIPRTVKIKIEMID